MSFNLREILRLILKDFLIAMLTITWLVIFWGMLGNMGLIPYKYMFFIKPSDDPVGLFSLMTSAMGVYLVHVLIKKRSFKKFLLYFLAAIVGLLFGPIIITLLGVVASMSLIWADNFPYQKKTSSANNS
jgi:hypothetical protein